MIWSIVNECDIFYDVQNSVSSPVKARSSNPYDYIRCGFCLDKASMFGGKDIVDYNSDFSGNRSGADLSFPLSESGHSAIFMISQEDIQTDALN